MKLDIGCGGRKIDGSVGVDVLPSSDCDILGDAHNLPIRDRVADKIESYEVLEHLPSPTRAVAEYERVLKERGVLVMSVPNVMLIRCFLRWAFKGVVSVYHEHIQGWRLCEMKHLLRRNNLDLLKADFVTWEYATGNFLERTADAVCPRLGGRSLRVYARPMRRV